MYDFKTLRLDYTNALLYGVPSSSLSRLQRVQHAAARLVMKARWNDHITTALRDLHWLPVRRRIEYKILVLVFKALKGLAPPYITDMVSIYIPERPLRSANGRLLKVPKTKTKTFGDRSFYKSAPVLWNSLPPCIRNCNTLDTFKRQLKTHIFRQVYSV